ncbi:OmpA family protein [Magnetospirillum molischianum]|uniref:Outer membrane protein and related peptidoglycan-associated lipo protein n=1 Tax=Magnetospirillum molischianum DSM 120 TaxID=1150626 RepID=H8FVJ8_MAGML|nr:OmpA family protein [Magnetospirillum molischianum]CCG42386.1 Outer membrane protein and related peptidoglycan-associated lipo protein [Magnetospirillum molischianum DSM 120]
MKRALHLMAPLLLCGLAACTGTPQNGMIPRSTYQLELLNRTTPTGSPFTQALTTDYRTLALYEWGEYDWFAQQVFAKKGLAAAAGNAVPPERLEDWHVSDADAAADLRVARGYLVTLLAGDAPRLFPQWSSTAQTQFDCWLHEQYEGWETERIRECRDGFRATITQIAARQSARAAPAAEESNDSVARKQPTSFIVFFDFDKSDLMPASRQVIAAAIKAITATKGSKAKIVGYTDTSGTDKYNHSLSLRRGKSVEQELTSNGIPAETISIEGKGESDLLLATPDGVREPQNRRATIQLIKP